MPDDHCIFPHLLPENFSSAARGAVPFFGDTVGDIGIDLSHGFWGLDSLMASDNIPDEQAAAEQLLAFQTPPDTDLAIPPADSWPCPPSVPGERVSHVHGVDKMASQLTGAMPSGLFQRKDQGNSLFLGGNGRLCFQAL
jgi:hypothetical protein